MSAFELLDKGNKNPVYSNKSKNKKITHQHVFNYIIQIYLNTFAG